MIRVGIADDQPLVRAGLQALLDRDAGLVLVGEAADGQQAVDLARAVQPDVLLMDVRMPGMDGIETARRLVEQDPDVVVVLVSLEERVDLPSSVETAAAAAHIRKHQLTPRALHALWRAHGHGDQGC
jgi:DNA-binding NarL/FixJ family response regulator